MVRTGVNWSDAEKTANMIGNRRGIFKNELRLKERGPTETMTGMPSCLRDDAHHARFVIQEPRAEERPRAKRREDISSRRFIPSLRRIKRKSWRAAMKSV